METRTHTHTADGAGLDARRNELRRGLVRWQIQTSPGEGSGRSDAHIANNTFVLLLQQTTGLKRMSEEKHYRDQACPVHLLYHVQQQCQSIGDK